MPIHPAWHRPPAGLVLRDNDIHVWRVPIDRPGTTIQALWQTLSTLEQQRAERFRADRDRRRFIVSHGALRALLSRYLGIEPGRLSFEEGAHGKPRLAGRGVAPPAEFNLAHSGGLAVCAVTRQRPVGIDLEVVRPVLDADQIVERFFSARERAVYRSLPVDDRQAAFFACWTRKEAFIKLIGDGLSRPLDQFDVSLAPGEPARIVSIGGSQPEAQKWSLFGFVPGPNYLGALAVEARDGSPSYWTWEFSNAA